MQTFRVEDMTCGHCAGNITKAVHAVDARARIEFDLARHLVRIEPTEVDAPTLIEAIAQAGYSPRPVEAPRESAPARAAGGCCCGSGVSSCRT